MPVSESSPAINITSITFQAANCHPRKHQFYLSGRLCDEKLTTLTNLNFDSIPAEMFNGLFSRHFYHSSPPRPPSFSPRDAPFSCRAFASLLAYGFKGWGVKRIPLLLS